MTNLFCTRIQRTVDAVGRLKSQESELDCLLLTLVNCEDMWRYWKNPLKNGFD